MLDDERGEAIEIREKNPWLTYGRPLHLARTFGLRNKLFDLLDEAALVPPHNFDTFLSMHLPPWAHSSIGTPS